MKNQTKLNPIGFVVVYKRDGVVIEFQRTQTKEPKIHAHMQTAINAVKRLKNEMLPTPQDNGEWCAMTTQRLADIHKSQWGKAI